MRASMLVAATAAAVLSIEASAATLRFDDSATILSTNQWQYTVDDIEVTVTSNGGRIFYNSVEDAIGVGTNLLNGAMSWGETLTVSFDRPVYLSQISFRQWENPGPVFGIVYDEVVLSSGDTLLTLTDSGQGIFDLVDHFALPDLLVDSFTLTPNNKRTAVYLWGIDVQEVPLPGAVWLFGSALAGLGIVRRRRQPQLA